MIQEILLGATHTNEIDGVSATAATKAADALTASAALRGLRLPPQASEQSIARRRAGPWDRPELF
jgi:hypothetical protein